MALGLGDIIIQNMALLFKWWWCFSLEDATIWKRVICSCHNLETNRPTIQQKIRNGGGLWGTIFDIWKMDKDGEVLTAAGICTKVGDGINIWFKEDIWIGETTLMEKFPKLYSISYNSELQFHNVVAGMG